VKLACSFAYENEHFLATAHVSCGISSECRSPPLYDEEKILFDLCWRNRTGEVAKVDHLGSDKRVSGEWRLETGEYARV
jgi:hypothetical protein